jgi:C4-dicarboxylate-binding protein DctP
MRNIVALFAGTAGLALAAEAASAQDFNFTFAHVLTEDTPNHRAALAFAEEVAERSDGRIAVTVVPAAQLGGDVEIIEQIQMGLAHIGIPPTATLGNFEPRMQILDLPYILPDEQAMTDVLDDEVGRRMLDLLEQHNMKGLAFWGAGWRHMTTNQGPIQSPEDLQGIRMRTMQSPIIIGLYSHWNANPTAMAFTEVYNALQQGVVDGQENPYANIYGMRFHEVQNYLTETAHAYHAYAAVINLDYWNSLPEDLQEVMREAFESGRDNSRQFTDEWEADIRAEIGDEIEIVELTDEQHADFIEASRDVHDAFREELGPDLIDAIYEVTGQSSE